MSRHQETDYGLDVARIITVYGGPQAEQLEVTSDLAKRYDEEDMTQQELFEEVGETVLIINDPLTEGNEATSGETL